MEHRKEYDLRIIGQNLRKFREAKGLSVEEVRDYLQIGYRQSVYKWEEGICLPQADTLLALMELYHIELGDIISDIGQDSEITNRGPPLQWVNTLFMSDIAVYYNIRYGLQRATIV